MPDPETPAPQDAPEARDDAPDEGAPDEGAQRTSGAGYGNNPVVDDTDGPDDDE